MTEGDPSPDLLDALAAADADLDRGVVGPGAAIDALRCAGILTAPLPLSLGGRGLGTTPDGAHPLRRTLEALGGASLSIARLYEGHVNAVRLVADHATGAQRARIGRAVREGALMGVWGADRPEDPVRIKEGRLKGAKAFASGLGDVALAIVTASGDDGPVMVLADAGDNARHDLAAWDMDGMVGSRSGRFDASDLPAGPDDRLGAPGALLVEPAFHGGVWRLVACYAGAMDRIAREAHASSVARGGEDPVTRHRLGEIAMEARTAALWSRSACDAAEVADDADAAVSTALFAREAVEQAAGRQMALVERLGGTAIHRRDARLGRLLRDLRLYLRQANLDGKLALATALWEGGAGGES